MIVSASEFLPPFFYDGAQSPHNLERNSDSIPSRGSPTTDTTASLFSIRTLKSHGRRQENQQLHIALLDTKKLSASLLFAKGILTTNPPRTSPVNLPNPPPENTLSCFLGSQSSYRLQKGFLPVFLNPIEEAPKVLQFASPIICTYV